MNDKQFNELENTVSYYRELQRELKNHKEKIVNIKKVFTSKDYLNIENRFSERTYISDDALKQRLLKVILNYYDNVDNVIQKKMENLKLPESEVNND